MEENKVISSTVGRRNRPKSSPAATRRKEGKSEEGERRERTREEGEEREKAGRGKEGGEEKRERRKEGEKKRVREGKRRVKLTICVFISITNIAQESNLEQKPILHAAILTIV